MGDALVVGVVVTLDAELIAKGLPVVAAAVLMGLDVGMSEFGNTPGGKGNTIVPLAAMQAVPLARAAAPSGQAEQLPSDATADSATSPEGHVVQTTDPSAAYFPAPHGTQRVEPSTSSLRLPAAHVSHFSLPRLVE